MASSTALVTSLIATFWTVLEGPGIQILGVLLSVSVVFYGFGKLIKRFKA